MATPLDASDLGPAMRALKPQHQLFVAAYAENGGNAVQACRSAGYKADKMTGWRLLKREDVQAAVHELCEQDLKGLTPSALMSLKNLLADQNHKDHAKAVFAVMDRTGLHAVSEQRKVVQVADKELLSAIKVLAGELGFDAKKLLGHSSRIIDAEATEVEAEEFDGTTGLEDFL